MIQCLNKNNDEFINNDISLYHCSIVAKNCNNINNYLERIESKVEDHGSFRHGNLVSINKIRNIYGCPNYNKIKYQNCNKYIAYLESNNLI